MIDHPSEAAGSELDRRKLMLRAGFGAAVLGAMSVTGLRPASAAGVTDADILNFALNLEYLEAQFYLHAVFGTGLAANEITGVDGPPGAVAGGSKVPFVTPAIQQYASEIAQDEHNHVLFLRAALGSAAVAQPAIDIVNSFNTAAQLAGLGSSFDPYANEDSFLLGAYVFEDVGVTAYHGAAPLISNKAYLAAAAGILGVEAYHASEVRLLLYQLGYFSQTAAISALRAKASGTGPGTPYPADDQGVEVGGVANIVPTDSNSLVFARTPRQVLNVVYLGATPGGFFPKGMNGNIR